MLKSSSPSLAYFVTPHGYGHAARAAAVIQVLHQRLPELKVEIFTQIPAWFFADSVRGPYQVHPILTDIGLVQRSSLGEDIPATLEKLDQFYPLAPALVQTLAQTLREMHCLQVICDISVLGIAAARAAGLPSILIENFTWDWIYAGYAGQYPAITRHNDDLAALYASASAHLQAEPFCAPWPAADLICSPIARLPRASAAETRQRLEIPEGKKMVLITMGGVGEDLTFIPRLKQVPEAFFVIPGSLKHAQRFENVLLLPSRSDFYHPDLALAADAVIGKAGYSTLAEVYHAGVPFGAVQRSRFREAQVLRDFCQQHLPGIEIEEQDFLNGSWLGQIPALLQIPRVTRSTPNGAFQAADFILARL